MKFIKKVWYWLVRSSENSGKTSLTVKAFLTGIVTGLTVLAGLAHIQFPSVLVTQVVDTLVSLTQVVLLIVSGIATAGGLVRKLVTTLDGRNDVVNSHPVFSPEIE